MPIIDLTLHTRFFSQRYLSCLIKIALVSAFFTVDSSVVKAELTDGGSEPLHIDFNPNFIHGSGIDISRFSQQNPVPPGNYNVKVVVNNTTKGRFKVNFVLADKQTSATPCFTYKELLKIGIKPAKNKLSDNEQCYSLNHWIERSSVNYDPGDFELILQVPQIHLIKSIPGVVESSLWEKGSTVAFLDYVASTYASRQRVDLDDKQETNNYVSNNFDLNAGINLGAWRLRKRININWQKGEGSMYTKYLWLSCQRYCSD